MQDRCPFFWTGMLLIVAAVVSPCVAEPLFQFADGSTVHSFQVSRADGSMIDAYFVGPDQDPPKPKPVLLLLQGSGCNSVFVKGEGGVSVPFLIHELRTHTKDFNVVLVEKRGVDFGDDAGNSGMARCSKTYVEHATRDGRVEDAVTVIDHLIAKELFDGSTLVVAGHSEGADVAPGVASGSEHVSHLVLLGFTATHGPFDSLITLRNRLQKGALTAEQFSERYDELVERYGRIRDNPDTLEGFQDHTHRRWSSYIFGQVLDDLLRVDVPIYLGIASNDTSAPPLGADLVVAEFLKRGKRNLTHRNYVGYDHGFATGEGDQAELRHDIVLRDLMDWLEKHPVRESAPRR